MKTLVLYYSYSGNTKNVAREAATVESADIAEIFDRSRPGKLRAYTAGIVASIRGKAWPIQPLGVDLSAYDRLIMLSPVWASNPTPAFNAALKLLPEGKTVAIKMISASGKSECKERVESVITSKGGTLESFEDVMRK